MLTGVRDGSFRRSSQKLEGILTLRDARVERNCLEKLSSVMITVLRLVLRVGDIGIGAGGGVSNVRHVSGGGCWGYPTFAVFFTPSGLTRQNPEQSTALFCRWILCWE